jgi:glycosyltransferase involved in cell wall biosynthesis
MAQALNRSPWDDVVLALQRVESKTPQATGWRFSVDGSPPGMPRVSIITPVYNGERYLDEAIQSVLAQTYEDWELLLIDDGSADRSMGIAKGYAARYPGRVRCLEHPGRINRGQFATRIVGAASSRSGIVAMLDQDDVWDSNYLAEHLQIWDEVSDRNVFLSYGPSLYWFPDSSTGSTDFIQKMPLGGQQVYPPGELLETFLFTNYANTPCPSCTFVRQEVFGALTKFESLAKGSPFEDQYLWWYAAARWPVAVHSNVWVRYRQHGESAIVKLNRSRKQACLAELRFLRTIKDDLTTVHPDHPLLRDKRLAIKIRGLRTDYARHILRERLPSCLYDRIRILYRATSATLKPLF